MVPASTHTLLKGFRYCVLDSLTHLVVPRIGTRLSVNAGPAVSCAAARAQRPRGFDPELGVHALAAVTAVVNDDAEPAVEPESRGDVLRHVPARQRGPARCPLCTRWHASVCVLYCTRRPGSKQAASALKSAPPPAAACARTWLRPSCKNEGVLATRMLLARGLCVRRRVDLTADEKRGATQRIAARTPSARGSACGPLAPSSGASARHGASESRCRARQAGVPVLSSDCLALCPSIARRPR